jgi:hypothetical protein
MSLLIWEDSDFAVTVEQAQQMRQLGVGAAEIGRPAEHEKLWLRIGAIHGLEEC